MRTSPSFPAPAFQAQVTGKRADVSLIVSSMTRGRYPSEAVISRPFPARSSQASEESGKIDDADDCPTLKQRD